jgi:hypothetical protein
LSFSSGPASVTTPGDGTRTDPRAVDERLRGRTYAIPFDRVWKVALRLAGGGLRAWSLQHADDQVGLLQAQAPTWTRRHVDVIEVRVRLDENAQTRVDLHCRRTEAPPRKRRHIRLIEAFFRRLDRDLEAGTTEILDPTRTPGWMVEERA